MKKELVAVLFALAFVSASSGLDITTREGIAYLHCEIVKVESDGIRITHDGGAAKLLFEELPDAMQRQYGFDAAKAAANRKAIADAKEAAAKIEAEQQIQREQAASLAREQQARHDAFVRAEAEKEAERQEAKERQRKANEEAAESRREMFAKLTYGAVICGALIFYFLPTIIGRRKANAMAIFVMNLLLGWSFVGWVIALVWACTKDAKPAVQTVIINPIPQPRAVPRPVVKGVVGRVVESQRLPPKA